MVRGRRKESLVHTVHTYTKFPWYSASLKLMEISVYLLSHRQEKSAYLAEVSVMDSFMKISKILRNPGGTKHVQTVCTRLFFLCPRTRAWERG